MQAIRLFYGASRSPPMRAAPALAALALLALAAVAPAASANWASFHGDDRKTGAAPGTDFKVPGETWWTLKAEGGAQVKASPILKDGVLITAATNGLVQAIDATNGRELWRYAMPAAVEGTGAIAGERVYVVDIAGNLRALNLRDGRAESSLLVGPTYASITEHEGKLFIGNEAGEMRAILSSSLTVLWTFNLAELRTTASFSATTGWTCGSPVAALPIRGAAAVYGGKVYFGALNHYVYALAEDGTGDGKTIIRWVHKTGDIVVGTPTLATTSGTARVIVGSYDGNVHAYLATQSGEAANPCFGTMATPNWSFQVPDPVAGTTARGAKVHSSPANDGARVYVGANNGKVFALNAADGAKVWEQTAGSNLAPVTSSPAVANGILTVGSDDKKVYWMGANNGTILHTAETPAAVGTSPAIDGPLAYIAANDGTLYAFGPVRPKLADLVATDGKATTTLLWLDIANKGEAASVATTARYLRNGQPWLTLDVPAIPAGGKVRVEAAIDIPAGTADYIFTLDPDNKVAESDEGNNGSSGPYTVEAPPAPLPATTTTTPTTPDVGIPSPWAGIAVLAAALLALRRRK